MRSRDCDELARLLLAAEPVIKSRLRRIRAGTDSSDRAWSTSDAFSSVMRRVMAAGRSGSIRCMGGAPPSAPGNPGMRAMWSFIDSILRSVAGDSGRRRQRQRRQARAAVEVFRSQRHDVPPSPRVDAPFEALSRTLRSLDPLDRSIVLLRLRGAPWASVAAAHAMDASACRQRWSRTIARLRTWSALDLGAAPTLYFRRSGDFPVTSAEDHPANSGGTSLSTAQGAS